jgi:hypothetical protein
VAAEVWYLSGWVGPTGTQKPTMEVWANREETRTRDNMRAASDLYYGYDEGLADKPSWAGPGGLVLKFVRDGHPLAGLKTVYWTIQ